VVSPEQVAAFVTFYFADAGQKLRLQHGLISVGVLGLGVSVPDSCDHVTSFGILKSCEEHFEESS
jgi:hypothetical protein